MKGVYIARETGHCSVCKTEGEGPWFDLVHPPRKNADPFTHHPVHGGRAFYRVCAACRDSFAAMLRLPLNVERKRSLRALGRVTVKRYAPREAATNECNLGLHSPKPGVPRIALHAASGGMAVVCEPCIGVLQAIGAAS